MKISTTEAFCFLNSLWLKFFFFLFLGLSHSLSADSSIREKLSQIPPKDQETLSCFFKGLLTQGNFALTLFGYRPSCLLTYQLSYTLKIAPPQLRARFLMEYESWKTWEKYQHHFETKNFIFRKLPSIEEVGSFTILFAHKEKVASILTQHADLFPNSSNMEEVLVRTFSNQDHESPQYHLLQGVLLGYGLENAKAFQNMFKVENDLLEKQKFDQKGFLFRHLWKSTNPFFCTKPCGHLAFDMPHDPELSSKQQNIVDLYNSDSFLEDFLTLLTK